MSIVIAVLLLFLLGVLARVRMQRRQQRTLQTMEPGVQLAVLKETLLEQPFASNLQALQNFCQIHALPCDTEPYQDMLQTQRTLAHDRSKHENPIAADEELYTQQCQWLDTLEPLELREAREAEQAGAWLAWLSCMLQATLRFYTDDFILQTLQLAQERFQGEEVYRRRVRSLRDAYQELCTQRDQSTADDKSLERLVKIKEDWVQSVQDLIELCNGPS